MHIVKVVIEMVSMAATQVLFFDVETLLDLFELSDQHLFGLLVEHGTKSEQNVVSQVVAILDHIICELFESSKFVLVYVRSTTHLVVCCFKFHDMLGVDVQAVHSGVKHRSLFEIDKLQAGKAHKSTLNEILPFHLKPISTKQVFVDALFFALAKSYLGVVED